MEDKDIVSPAAIQRFKKHMRHIQVIKKIRSIPTHVKVQLWMFLILPVNLLLMHLADMYPNIVEAFITSSPYEMVMSFVSRMFGKLMFSCAEIVILTAVICTIIFFIKWIIQLIRRINSKNGVFIFIVDKVSRVAAIFLCFVFIFNLMFGLAYRRTNTTQSVIKYNIRYSQEDIIMLAMYMLQDVNNARELTGFSDNENIDVTYSYNEMCDKLLDSYDNLGEEYPVYAGKYGRPKPVALSRPWTFMYVMGMYFPYTGEATYNTNIPDVELLHTILHEMAHQRSIAAEDEANFAAFMAAQYSSDPVIKYSGLLESFCIVMQTFYNDQETYNRIIDLASDGVKNDIKLIDEFWNSYSTFIAQFSNDVNNLYLKSNGQEFGITSYSLSTQYILDYYVNTYMSEYIVVE